VNDPVSVWDGELTLSGVTLHVHVLEDGRRIIDAADVVALWEAWDAGVIPDEGEAAALQRWISGGPHDDPPGTASSQERKD
jgi:hypothetical protein